MPVNAQHLAELLTTVGRQKTKLISMKEDLATTIPQWKSRTLRMMGGLLAPEELRIFDKINTSTFEADRVAFINYLGDLEEGLRDLPQHYLAADPLRDETKLAPISRNGAAADARSSRNVFVVHGHDTLAEVDLARTLEKLKLVPLVLHEQVNEGKTVIEKFERDASRVGFAVVLLTPDDTGHPVGKPGESKSRARQNVVLELGYFSGALGRANVCVLYKGDVEIPSDYLGVVYVRMDDSGAWKFSLAKELKQAGLPVDLNDLS